VLSTDPPTRSPCARGWRQTNPATGDTLGDRVTPSFFSGCHPQVGETIKVFAKGDRVTGFSIARCVRASTHCTVVVCACWVPRARVSDRTGCHHVTCDVMCRCFNQLRVTPSRFPKVSPVTLGVTREANGLAGCEGAGPCGLWRFSVATEARQRLSAALQALAAAATPIRPSEATAGDREAPAGLACLAALAGPLRFTAPVVAREDWCA